MDGEPSGAVEWISGRKKTIIKEEKRFILSLHTHMYIYIYIYKYSILQANHSSLLSNRSPFPPFPPENNPTPTPIKKQSIKPISKQTDPFIHLYSLNKTHSSPLATDNLLSFLSSPPLSSTSPFFHAPHRIFPSCTCSAM